MDLAYNRGSETLCGSGTDTLNIGRKEDNMLLVSSSSRNSQDLAVCIERVDGEEDRERGWHHMCQHQPCNVCTDLGAYMLVGDTGLRPSAGMRLPPETLHVIAVKLRELHIIADATHKRPRRRPTGPATLVCRHWANVCLRPSRGERWMDRLTGKDDVMTLRALVSAPGSYLKYSVTRWGWMTYWLGEADPWLHLLPETRRLLPNYDHEDCVDIFGPLCLGLQTLRSIHAFLPRSMPPAFSAGIRHLRLHDIHFAQFNHLQRLLDELPHLATFFGNRVAWPAGTLVYPSPSHRTRRETRCPHWLRYLDLRDCPYPCNLDAVALSASVYPHHSPFLRTICEPFAACSDEENYLEASWMPKNLPRRLTLCQSSHAILYRLAVGVSFYIHVLLSSTKDEVHSLHYDTPAVLLWFTSSAKLATAADWEVLEATAAQLHVRSIRVGRCSLDGHRPFGQHWKALQDDDKQFVISNVPSLAAAGVLSFSKPPPEMFQVWGEGKV